MLCPVDQTELRIVERQGVEIDYCPKCRGVWLDRGELDKVIDRTAETLGRAPGAAEPRYEERGPRYREDERYDERYRDRDRDHPYDREYGRRRRRESWLGDLFDFD
ncbi:MAG TPA: zf-TFIIB domain-containing protein [Chloroflexota bacterium]|jgi:Zn-finger nucleic acid-binding protein|nr:zf-TFIIB domain-containing protein [Chloroflexota bacterium]